MSFSLTNAPTTFQREMNDIFLDQICHFVVVFLYDILICSCSLDYHYTFVRFVMQTLQDKRFFAKASNCDFFKRFETSNYQRNKLNLGLTTWDLVLLISYENLFAMICN